MYIKSILSYDLNILSLHHSVVQHVHLNTSGQRYVWNQHRLYGKILSTYAFDVS